MAIGTGNISLQDVVDYFVDNGYYALQDMQDGQGNLTLDTCFRRSIVFGFNQNYGYIYSSTYSNNSLSNFKGYDHTLTQQLTVYDSLDNVITGPYIISDSNSRTASAGATYNFSAVSNGIWSLARPTWVSINPTSDQNPDTLTSIIITVQPQPTGGAERSGSVYINDVDNNHLFRFAIYQEAYNAQ